MKRVQTPDGIELSLKLIIIDDASTDGTTELLKTLNSRKGEGGAVYKDEEIESTIEFINLQFFSYEENQGKDAALRRGFDDARGDLIVVRDADL